MVLTTGSTLPASLRILPAPASTGIIFVRTDVDGLRVPASQDYVARVSYATALMRKGALIATTEHLLSALYGLGIDNAIVEIDNLEVPILDGSSLQFVKAIELAGLRSLRRKRRYIRIVKEVSVDSVGGRITVVPADRFRVSCYISFNHPLVRRQTMDLEINPPRYTSDIAPARMFSFSWELESMRSMGLMRGATLETGVWFDHQGTTNASGLQFVDEPCRHKILDIIGDLALLGKPLLGHVTAERPTHALTIALVAKILSDPSVYEIVTESAPHHHDADNPEGADLATIMPWQSRKIQ
jgi:UDP-3-O-[3-hydroxymyristoyl] N-acetylglucosamine deacetylase